MAQSQPSIGSSSKQQVSERKPVDLADTSKLARKMKTWELVSFNSPQLSIDDGDLFLSTSYDPKVLRLVRLEHQISTREDKAVMLGRMKYLWQDGESTVRVSNQIKDGEHWAELVFPATWSMHAFLKHLHKSKKRFTYMVWGTTDKASAASKAASARPRSTRAKPKPAATGSEVISVSHPPADASRFGRGLKRKRVEVEEQQEEEEKEEEEGEPAPKAARGKTSAKRRRFEADETPCLQGVKGVKLGEKITEVVRVVLLQGGNKPMPLLGIRTAIVSKYPQLPEQCGTWANQVKNVVRFAPFERQKLSSKEGARLNVYGYLVAKD
ncbi:hypothetical protein NA57DRAFT_78458 [Rhizodiscina lignyota]|uniref:Uncharacterized protein n=1 Tax=Rhizodiscina lignyota TaxID=1504668 RepID=A0A9P4IA35_9PEZI|nr:hypothetical protein NA57DRAFT_78458 [Rhizodiscina lignyota]